MVCDEVGHFGSAFQNPLLTSVNKCLSCSILHVYLFLFCIFHTYQALMSVPLVEACAVGLSEDSRLVAFMVASSASGDQKASSAFPSVQHQANQRSSAPVDAQGNLNPSNSHWQEELATSTRSLRRAIRRSLSRLLPSPSVPDKVVVVPALPLTSHGEPPVWYCFIGRSLINIQTYWKLTPRLAPAISLRYAACRCQCCVCMVYVSSCVLAVSTGLEREAQCLGMTINLSQERWTWANS